MDLGLGGMLKRGVCCFYNCNNGKIRGWCVLIVPDMGDIWRGLRGGAVNYLYVYVRMGEEFAKGWKGCFGERGPALC